MCSGQKARRMLNRRRVKNLWRRVIVAVWSSGVGRKELWNVYGDRGEQGTAAVQGKGNARDGPHSPTPSWTSWVCLSSSTSKSWCRWWSSSLNPEGHGTNKDVGLCRVVSWVASAVVDLCCATHHLVCFSAGGKSRGHVFISCRQPWLWQQSLCVGFIASWFNIWAKSLQGSVCLYPLFFLFIVIQITKAMSGWSAHCEPRGDPAASFWIF